MSQDAEFDESTSWYSLPTLTTDSDPMPKDEASEPEPAQVENDEARTKEESPESFRLSGPNDRLSQLDQSDDETASGGDSVVLSPRKEPRRRFTRKEKGKKKMPEFETGHDESDRCASDSGKQKGGSSTKKTETAKKGLKPGNGELRRSTRQKDPVMRYGYNEYMAHHYAYMTKVAEVREPESYAETAKDANWCAAMEEEMRALKLIGCHRHMGPR